MSQLKVVAITSISKAEIIHDHDVQMSYLPPLGLSHS